MKLEDKKGHKNIISNISLVLIGLIFVVLLFNQFQMNGLNKFSVTGAAIKITSGSSSDTVKLQSALKQITPTGVPAVYGQELGVSYDDPVKSMTILNQYDDLTGPDGRASKAITLSSDKEARYINITNSIGCEFCCGAQTLTTKTGEPACGCAHSGAMRGLAKYMLNKHPEITDDQILTELVKWKILFFPQDMAKKYLASQGVILNSNNNLPNGANVPSQVGGC